jgi:uncharacterized membrane protein YecN with MAPEG domain
MPFTLLAASVLGLILVVLSLEIVRLRVKTKVSLGTGPEERSALVIAVRAHGNFVEHVPLSLILLGLLEREAVGVTTIAGLAGVLVVSRLLHIVGIGIKGVNPFRSLGVVLQWAFFIVAGVVGIQVCATTYGDALGSLFRMTGSMAGG